MVVLAEVPGLALDGVDITLERQVLTIRGRSTSNDHARYQRVYSESSNGDYERAFTLSENIDWERIEATLRTGFRISSFVRQRLRTAKDRAQIRVIKSITETGQSRLRERTVLWQAMTVLAVIVCGRPVLAEIGLEEIGVKPVGASPPMHCFCNSARMRRGYTEP
jgi:hypothetical protein